MMQHALDIATTAGVFVIVSLGLIVVLGIMGVVNLAHGAFITIGGYTAVVVTNAGWNPWLSFLLAPAVGFLLGVATEYLLIRRLYRRPLDAILATWGLSIISIQVISEFFGRSAHFVTEPISGDPLRIFGAFESQYRLWCLAVACVLVIGLYLVSRFTSAGVIARAVIMNPGLARALGINTARVSSITFAVGSAMAAFAGAVIVPLSSVDPNLGMPWVITAFMVVLAGGVSIIGLALSALILATGETLAAYYFAQVIGNVVLITLPIVLLRVIPDGIVNARLPRGIFRRKLYGSSKRAT